MQRGLGEIRRVIRFRFCGDGGVFLLVEMPPAARAKRTDRLAHRTFLGPVGRSELSQTAAAKMSREAPGQTLPPTALVRAAWLRPGGDGQCWVNRAHFFGTAPEALDGSLPRGAGRA